MIASEDVILSQRAAGWSLSGFHVKIDVKKTDGRTYGGHTFGLLLTVVRHKGLQKIYDAIDSSVCENHVRSRDISSGSSSRPAAVCDNLAASRALLFISSFVEASAPASRSAMTAASLP